jgi:hypothetical protein
VLSYLGRKILEFRDTSSHSKTGPLFFLLVVGPFAFNTVGMAILSAALVQALLAVASVVLSFVSQRFLIFANAEELGGRRQ